MSKKKSTKTVAVKSTGAATLAIADMQPFQDNLKVLPDENYKRLRSEIISLGFSEPIAVWQHDGKNFVLNGHQRLETLKRMEADGFTIPPIPVSLIEADSVKQAKEKILSLTSQFGEITPEGLAEFARNAEIELDDFKNRFVFPEIDLEAFYQDIVKGAPTDEDWANQFEQKGDTTGVDNLAQVTFVLEKTILADLLEHLKGFDENKNKALGLWLIKSL